MRALILTMVLGAALLLPVAAQDVAPAPTEQAETAAADTPAAPHVLTLDEAKRIALSDNPSLQAAEERVRQARARVQQARAAFFPQVEAIATASETWMPERDLDALRRQTYQSALAKLGQFSATADTPAETAVGFFGSRLGALYARSQVDDSTETYTAGLRAVWTVFDGFAREFSYAAAKFNAREFEAAHQEARRLLLDAVANAFYAVQLAREDILIAEADRSFNARQLKEAQARRRVGTGSLSDELNFEVRVNAARARLVTATHNHETALIGLAALLGVPEAELGESTEVAPLESEVEADLQLPDVEPLIQAALDGRPDVHQSRYGLRRAQAAANARRGAFYPAVTLSASREAVLADSTDFEEEDFATTLGMVVSVDLFAGGRNCAGYKEAKAARSEAERNLQYREIAAVSEVRRAVEGLRAAQEALRIQRANAVYVEKNRDLVEKGYAVGQESLVRLNEAQRDLIQAESSLALARVSLFAAWHALRTATAETLAAFD